MKDLVGERIVPFDSDSSALAAELFNKIGRPRTRRVDIMIAAIAISQRVESGLRGSRVSGMVPE